MKMEFMSQSRQCTHGMLLLTPSSLDFKDIQIIMLIVTDLIKFLEDLMMLPSMVLTMYAARLLLFAHLHGSRP